MYVNCNMYIYSDGEYMIDLIDTEGTWSKNKDDSSKITLIGSDTMAFSKMNLKSFVPYKTAYYMNLEILDPVETSHSDFEHEGDFIYQYSWYRDFYLTGLK